MRVVPPPIPLKLHLEIPILAQNPQQLQRLVVFTPTLRGIFMSISWNMNAPTVINGLLGTLSTVVFKTAVRFAVASATTPSTVRTDSAPSAMIPAMSLQIVPSLRTPAVVSSSMMETQRESDLAPVVQVFEGGIVTV